MLLFINTVQNGQSILFLRQNLSYHEQLSNSKCQWCRVEKPLMGGWARGNLTAGSIIGLSILQERVRVEKNLWCILKSGVKISNVWTMMFNHAYITATSLPEGRVELPNLTLPSALRQWLNPLGIRWKLIPFGISQLHKKRDSFTDTSRTLSSFRKSQIHLGMFNT